MPKENHHHRTSFSSENEQLNTTWSPPGRLTVCRIVLDRQSPVPEIGSELMSCPWLTTDSPDETRAIAMAILALATIFITDGQMRAELIEGFPIRRAGTVLPEALVVVAADANADRDALAQLESAIHHMMQRLFPSCQDGTNSPPDNPESSLTPFQKSLVQEQIDTLIGKYSGKAVPIPFYVIIGQDTYHCRGSFPTKTNKTTVDTTTEIIVGKIRNINVDKRLITMLTTSTPRRTRTFNYPGQRECQMLREHLGEHHIVKVTVEVATHSDDQVTTAFQSYEVVMRQYPLPETSDELDDGLLGLA